MSLLRTFVVLLSIVLSLAVCMRPKDSQTVETEPTVGEAQTPASSNSSNSLSPPPVLQIDTGGHKGLIMDMAFTPDGRYLISAGENKLIRVWELETGRSVRILRDSLGAGGEGKILAMALSPDGQWLAVGGLFDGTSDEKTAVRLYDFVNGQLKAQLKGHTSAVLALGFSSDSRLLVSGGFDETAILWDVTSQQRLHTLSGHTGHIYVAAITKDNQRVVTGSSDQTLRLWQVEDGVPLATLEGHTDEVVAMAISPRDGIIVSSTWEDSIHLWDGYTGDYIKILANSEVNANRLAFSPNGRYLVSCTADGLDSNCHVWAYPSGKKVVTYQGHDNIVQTTTVSPDGQWVATSGGESNEIHLWSLREGKLLQRLRGLGGKTFSVGISKDGKALAWGKSVDNQSINQNQRGPLEYSLAFPTTDRPLGVPKAVLENEGTGSLQQTDMGTTPKPVKAGTGSALSRGASINSTISQPSHSQPSQLSTQKGVEDFRRAQDKWNNWSLGIQHGTGRWYQSILEIRHQGRTVANIERGATSGYVHSAYTFTPDGQRIISGGLNGVLSAYNREGKKLGDYVGHTMEVMAVVVSPDGRLLISGSADQTVRVWNLESRENLLTLFHGADGEWVAWTPTGHYTASLNGAKMVDWYFSRGENKAVDSVTADQLRQQLYRPDIITNVVLLGSVEEAIAKAGNTDFNPEQLASR
jgi:WD40 repeat protein